MLTSYVSMLAILATAHVCHAGVEHHRPGRVAMHFDRFLSSRKTMHDGSTLDVYLEYVGPRDPTPFEIEYVDLPPKNEFYNHRDRVDMLQTDNEEIDTFSVTAAGAGQLTGASFRIPGHTRGNITVRLSSPALTSKQVDTLKAGWKAIVDNSVNNKLEEHEKTDTSGSANLGFLGFFSGGAKATTTKTKTRDHMTKLGLSDEQISSMMDTFNKIALEMSTVEARLEVDNTANRYSVSGNIMLYVMEGDIYTNSNNTATSSYRVLGNAGAAGSNDQFAPAKGEIAGIPL